MKKTLSVITTSLLAIGVVTSLAAAEKEVFPKKLKESEIEKIKKEYPQMLNNPNTQIVKAYDQGDFKQLQVKVSFNTPKGPQSQKFDVYTVKGTKTLFAGNAYKPTGEKYDLPVDAKMVEEGVAFTVGKGKEVVYLVTNPECPHCQRLETSMPSNIGEKYTIKVIPLTWSRDMTYWSLAGGSNDEIAKRMHAVMTGDKAWSSYKPTPEEMSKFDAIIEKGVDAANELNAKGTPMVFNSKFEQIDTSVLVNLK